MWRKVFGDLVVRLSYVPLVPTLLRHHNEKCNHNEK